MKLKTGGAMHGRKTAIVALLLAVGVQAATTDYDAALVMHWRGELGSIKVYPFDRIKQAMRDLEAERIMAVMKVAPVASWLASKSPVGAFVEGGKYNNPNVDQPLPGAAIGDFARSVFTAFPDMSLEVISIGDPGGDLVALQWGLQEAQLLALVLSMLTAP
jgi:hypothetical protein